MRLLIFCVILFPRCAVCFLCRRLRHFGTPSYVEVCGVSVHLPPTPLACERFSALLSSVERASPFTLGLFAFLSYLCERVFWVCVCVLAAALTPPSPFAFFSSSWPLPL